ncbi:hypothetical protein AB4536_17005 [Vibrio cyclitrophicus]
MSKIIIHIPKLQQSGGNLISKELADYLVDEGYDVLIFTGFSFCCAHEVDLTKRKKNIVNSLSNLLAFFNCSLVSLFYKNTVATHHLTALFNFIRPVKYAFIQDIEKDFYPQKFKAIGTALWNIYLMSEVKFSTNVTLLNRSTTASEKSVGVSFFSQDINAFQAFEREIDVLLILRDGDYKSPDLTLNLHRRLLDKKVNCFLINASRQDLNAEPNVIDALQRSHLLDIFRKTKIFVCLSKWEGLGLPNIESYLSGCTVLSTGIPSLVELSAIDNKAVFELKLKPNDCLIDDVLESLYSYKVPNSRELIERQVAVDELTNTWKEYISRVFQSK